MKIISFNGIDLSDYIRITDIIRPVGNSRNLGMSDVATLGTHVQEVKVGPKIIKVRFALQAQNERTMEELKHRLAGVFNTDKAVKIEFSDEPGKYYLGMINGFIEPHNLTRWLQKGEFELLIPDGVAHSTTYRTQEVRGALVSGNKVTIPLTNNGTVDAHPIITIRHNAENGYVGLVNASGALEVGNREEADVEIVKQSEVLLDFRESLSTALGRATRNVAINNDTAQRLVGTVSRVNMWGRNHLSLSARGGTSGNNAGSLTWTIPADSAGQSGSLNDYLFWKQIFWLGAADQYGFLKISVSDDQGRFLYGVETYKRQHGLDCEYNLHVSDGKGGFTTLRSWSFRATHNDSENPFNQNRGWSDIKRNDDKITFYWFGRYFPFTVPELKGRKSAKVHVTFGAIGNHQLVSHMYLDALIYRKDHVAKTRNIPNRYAFGTELEINCETDTVTLDGLDRTRDVVPGSVFPTIPPGQSSLELYCSSWVGVKPLITVKFEERWL